MGCTDSKLDHLPAVSLCRDRCRALDDALHLSYALTDAHVAYLQSLRAFGGSLNRFVSAQAAPGSPKPNGEEMPKQPQQPVSSAFLGLSSSSNSSSHIHFNSDSDDDGRQKLTTTSSQLGHVEGHYNPSESSNPIFDQFESISYERSQPPQYSTYVQPIYDTYPNQGITTGSGSKPQPPIPLPPPPLSNSTWDFLNFFESYGGYEQPSRSSGRGPEVSNSDADVMTIKRETMIPMKIAVPESEPGKNRDVTPAVKSEKSVCVQAEKRKSTESLHDGCGKDLGEVMKEVESLFEKASESGLTVLLSLDNAKFGYQQRFSVLRVSSKVLHTIVPSSSDKIDPNPNLVSGLDEEATVVETRNFSSTLRNLHMWEKKLYGEVKAEENLRVIYSRKCKELKQLIEKEKEGEADRIQSNQMMIKNLSTKLKISLHVVDAVSNQISKLRDDELWPCLCQLLLGLLEMWKVMEDCYQRQHEAIADAKFVTDQKQDYGIERLEETMQVKLDLQSLELCFCKWVTAQKTCAMALDGWLMKCLSSEPEGSPPVLTVSHRWANASALDASRTMPMIGTVTKLVGALGGIYDEGYARLHAKAVEDKELERKTKALERKDGRMRSEIRDAIRRGVIPGRPLEAGVGIKDGMLGGASDVGLRLENMLEAMAKYSAYCVETYEDLCKLCRETTGML